MRLGIRLQVLLALGALLVVAFVPLYFAVASLTRAALGNARADGAVSLGRAVAGHVAVARATRTVAEMEPLLSAQLGAGGVTAVGVYGPDGRLATKAAEDGWDGALPAAVEPGVERIGVLRASRGSASLVVVPHTLAEGAASGGAGAVAVLVRTDAGASHAAPLLRLVAMYTGIVGLGLLVLAYIAMTRLVVRPIVELEVAARRVREGGRRFEASSSGAAEIVDVSHSVARMTEQLRVEEAALRQKVAEVERYARDLERAQERLVRSERLASVGRLAAGLSHEIGNPLSAILGFQELILSGGLSREEERDFLERMKRETERIHRVLRDLLDFARPAGRQRLSDAGGAATPAAEDRPSSVADAVSDAVALVRPQKDWKDIDLAADVARDVPLVTLGHERLVQVLLNLLLNAGDVVPRGAGRVIVRAACAAGGRVRIEVDDNGPGVAPEIEPLLFEPFATTKDVGKGTGLGLAVCRGLVEAAGGSISAERGDLGGARFIVELPAAE